MNSDRNEGRNRSQQGRQVHEGEDRAYRAGERDEQGNADYNRATRSESGRYGSDQGSWRGNEGGLQRGYSQGGGSSLGSYEDRGYPQQGRASDDYFYNEDRGSIQMGRVDDRSPQGRSWFEEQRRSQQGRDFEDRSNLQMGGFNQDRGYGQSFNQDRFGANPQSGSWQGRQGWQGRGTYGQEDRGDWGFNSSMSGPSGRSGIDDRGQGGYFGMGGSIGYGQGNLQQGGYGSRGQFNTQGQYGSHGAYGQGQWGQGQQSVYGPQGMQGQYGQQGQWGQGQYGQQGQRGPIGQSGLRGGMYGRGPLNYTRSDQRIYEDVCDALSDDEEIDASQVEVKVEKGEVTLSGTVQNRDARRRIEDVVERISGVKEINNQVKVQRLAQGQTQNVGASSDRTLSQGSTSTTGITGGNLGSNGTLTEHRSRS